MPSSHAQAKMAKPRQNKARKQNQAKKQDQANKQDQAKKQDQANKQDQAKEARGPKINRMAQMPLCLQLMMAEQTSSVQDLANFSQAYPAVQEFFKTHPNNLWRLATRKYQPGVVESVVQCIRAQDKDELCRTVNTVVSQKEWRAIAKNTRQPELPKAWMWVFDDKKNNWLPRAWQKLASLEDQVLEIEEYASFCARWDGLVKKTLEPDFEARRDLFRKSFWKIRFLAVACSKMDKYIINSGFEYYFDSEEDEEAFDALEDPPSPLEDVKVFLVMKHLNLCTGPELLAISEALQMLSLANPQRKCNDRTDRDTYKNKGSKDSLSYMLFHSSLSHEDWCIYFRLLTVQAMVFPGGWDDAPSTIDFGNIYEEALEWTVEQPGNPMEEWDDLDDWLFDKWNGTWQQ